MKPPMSAGAANRAASHVSWKHHPATSGIGRPVVSVGLKEAAHESKRYDAIVIGSGISGLASAILLQKRGYKVLCIERHSTVGGTMHTFTADKDGFRWEFDSGVHHCTDELTSSRLFSYLCDNKVAWCAFEAAHDNAQLCSNQA